MKPRKHLAYTTGHPSLAGFTLVELLVVLLIIGLGFSVVGVNVAGNNAHRLLTEAKQFANHTGLIAQEAVLANQQWGVDFYRQDAEGVDQYGYRWLVRTEEDRWLLADDEQREIDFSFSPGIELRITLEGGTEPLLIKPKREIETQQTLVSQLRDKPESIVDELTSEEAEQKEPVLPSLWLFSSGEISAFSIELFDSENPDSIVLITGDELGRIVVVSGADNASI